MSKIALKNICYAYTDHGQSFQALEKVDVTINHGEFICVLGRSGCGKTTMLRLIAGLQKPQSGMVCIDDREVCGPDTDRAVVFQSYALFPWMTAQKNIQFSIHQAKKNLNRSELQSISLEFLKKVGMEQSADKYPYQLSGGMQQRVAIARALAMDTDILLLDEPFGALDARTRRELQELLEQLWNNGAARKTVLFVTHDINEAVLLADRILYMTPGRIAADIPVNIPRPRNEQSEQMKSLRRQLLELFYESGKGAALYESSL